MAGSNRHVAEFLRRKSVAPESAWRGINWAKVRAGERRWGEWKDRYMSGERLITPRTGTLEEMAECSDQRFWSLALDEIEANDLRELVSQVE